MATIERRSQTPEGIERRSALDCAISQVAEWRLANPYGGSAVPDNLLPAFQQLVDAAIAWRDDGLTAISLALIASGRINKARRSYSGNAPVRINVLQSISEGVAR